MISSTVRRFAVALVTLVVLLLAVFLLAVAVGAARLPLSSLFAGDAAASLIFWDLRLPRVCLAGLVGATLALSGVTFQTMLRNPLADPFVLGISGGAGAAAATATSLGWAHIPGLLPLISFAGALGATMFVVFLSRRGGRLDSSRLILSGLVMNAFCSAIILLAVSLSRASDMALAIRWMMGGFFTGSWRDVAILAASTAAAWITLLLIAGDVRMLEFGDDDARARGIDPDRISTIAVVASALATGVAVSVSGIIGFIGLLVPHAIRSIWRSDYRALIHLCALGGAILLIAADAVSRVVIAPSELPVGVLTAFLGVPFFITLLRRSSGE